MNGKRARRSRCASAPNGSIPVEHNTALFVFNRIFKYLQMVRVQQFLLVSCDQLRSHYCASVKVHGCELCALSWCELPFAHEERLSCANRSSHHHTLLARRACAFRQTLRALWLQKDASILASPNRLWPCRLCLNPFHPLCLLQPPSSPPTVAAQPCWTHPSTR